MKYPKQIIFVLTIVNCVNACTKNGVIDSPTTASPQITSIRPTSGHFGTIDTIIGHNFMDTDSVKFNGITAAVLHVSADTLIVTVPKRAGTGPVMIVRSRDTVAGPIFTYLYTFTVTTLAGSGTDGYLDGPAASAKFLEPHSITVDKMGNVFVLDGSFHGFQSNRIRKISVSGVVSTIAGADSAGYMDGVGMQAAFKSPLGLTIDSQGNFFISDSYNYRIRRSTPTGVVTTLAGNGLKGFINGAPTAAEFNMPYNITVDAQGNAYVSDPFNYCIRKIAVGGQVTTYAGTGTQGWVDGISTNAKFSSPSGLCIDNQGNLYVSEYTYIRKVSTSGIVSTIAGNNSGGAPGYQDGPAADARFSYPNSLAVDLKGNIYIADFGNNRIRKISPEGIVSTIAGSVYGFQDGDGKQALFNNPQALALDTDGNIYVCDAYNARIRKILIE